MFLYRIMSDCYSFCLRVFFNVHVFITSDCLPRIFLRCIRHRYCLRIFLRCSRFRYRLRYCFQIFLRCVRFQILFLLLLPLFVVTVNVFSFLLSSSSSSLITITSFLSFSSSLMSITGIPNFLFSFSIAASHISFVIFTTFGTVLCGFLLKYLFLCGFFPCFFPVVL